MASFEFKLPDIGEGVVEGEIVKWLVKEGDEVGEDQPLVEVMTDKATVTIPSPKKGRVTRLFGSEGQIAKVHHPLLSLEVDGESGKGTATGAASEPPPARAASPGGDDTLRTGARVLATPVTRRIAREHGLDLGKLVGSGPQGRVTKADVQLALQPPSRAPGPGGSAPSRPRPPPAPVGARAEDQRVPLRGLRKRIAEKMVTAKFTAPHFTFVEELDASALVAMRTRINQTLAEANDPFRYSYLPFICRALVLAMREFPTLNANFDEASQELIVRGACHFGIAVATPEGLTVPVVRNVQGRSLRELGEEIVRLGAAARDRKLTLEELTGGTFTITSLGQTGGLFATPIINHPEVAILGVHRIRKRPVVADGQVVIRDMVYLSLSFDHRVIDGAVGADFTYALIRRLERPELLFLDQF